MMKMRKKIIFFRLWGPMFLNLPLSMLVNGKEVLNTEEEFNTGQMGLFLKVIGEIIWQRGRED